MRWTRHGLAHRIGNPEATNSPPRGWLPSISRSGRCVPGTLIRRLGNRAAPRSGGWRFPPWLRVQGDNTLDSAILRARTPKKSLSRNGVSWPPSATAWPARGGRRPISNPVAPVVRSVSREARSRVPVRWTPLPRCQRARPGGRSCQTRSERLGLGGEPPSVSVLDRRPGGAADFRAYPSLASRPACAAASTPPTQPRMQPLPPALAPPVHPHTQPHT